MERVTQKSLLSSSEAERLSHIVGQDECIEEYIWLLKKCDRRWAIVRKILEHVRKEGTPGDECWIWQGPTSGSGRGGGYGRMNLDGQTVSVHRVMFTTFFGMIPGKKHIDHTCRNRLCCRPKHLELVTHKQNCRRRDNK